VESAQRANATFKTAQAQSNRAQAELLAAQRQLNVIATQKQQARAALIQARAERDLAQLNVGYTELRAPVDGVIGNRRARLGAMPRPVRNCCRWCPPAACGSMPISRKTNWHA
jgi:membrane fusion protein (multidrug efflux system)